MEDQKAEKTHVDNKPVPFRKWWKKYDKGNRPTQDEIDHARKVGILMKPKDIELLLTQLKRGQKRFIKQRLSEAVDEAFDLT